MPLLPWQGLRTFRDRIVPSSPDTKGQPVLLQNQVHTSLQFWPPCSLSNKCQTIQMYHSERHPSSLIIGAAYRWNQNPGSQLSLQHPGNVPIPACHCNSTGNDCQLPPLTHRQNRAVSLKSTVGREVLSKVRYSNGLRSSSSG